MALTTKQRRHFEERLIEERSRIQRSLGRFITDESSANDQDQSGDLTKIPLHPADLGTDTMQAELDAANAMRESRELAEIDAALERIHTSPQQFGICEDTGVEIPLARLEIIPWARTCGPAAT